MRVRPHEQKALDKLTDNYKSALAMQSSETGLLRLVKGGYALVQTVKVGRLFVREFRKLT